MAQKKPKYDVFISIWNIFH